MFNLTVKSLKIQSSEKTFLPIMAKSFEIDNTHSMKKEENGRSQIFGRSVKL